MNIICVFVFDDSQASCDKHHYMIVIRNLIVTILTEPVPLSLSRSLIPEVVYSNSPGSVALEMVEGTGFVIIVLKLAYSTIM